jgi:uncharacterized protein (TIGR00255 family)
MPDALPPLASPSTALPALASMTGFARTEGEVAGLSWAWELRSVNSRGLDLRFRLPPGYDAMEPGLREAVGKQLRRGSVTANLTIKREEQARLAADPAMLEEVLRLVEGIAARIPGCAPPRAEALLALPGVLRPASALPDEGAARAQEQAVRAGFLAALDALVVSRRGEGARLAATLGAQLDEVAALRAQAEQEAADQPAAQRARMLEAVQALLREGTALPEERIAQEVAVLAARSDVREELDRLASHIAAARGLLAEAANVGRPLDFLVQEFNREANTLCSKSASVALTATGLRLKAVLEQLREQVQNIE